jgi:hypothetical protein
VGIVVNKGKGGKMKKTPLVLVMLAMVLLVIIGLGVKTSHADDLDNVLSVYGRPDISDSTEFDNPRPPIVTKWLIYKTQGVKFWFVPDAKLGDAPPYKGWKLIGLQDDITLKPLTASEVQRRFGR